MEYTNRHDVLKEKFSQGAEEYDKQRRHVIPCLEDLYRITVDLANVENPKPKILDLGAGTGLLTLHLHNKYPDGDYLLLDLSEEMLNIAKTRFKNAQNFRFMVADYLKQDFKGQFDIVVSSLSIHHLEHPDKIFLYEKIYQHLNTGGIFINADQVLGPNQANEKEYYRNWLSKIDMGSLSESEKTIILDRIKLDKPASLADNFKWLEKTGFVDVDVYYKYYNFVVLYGKRF
ncbi:MAG TPA: class I SAM-dependent methyltransferase [Methanothermobacter sp.]|nr:class I SAM-dependent methyltransferase [Methanothermobacter sp.]